VHVVRYRPEWSVTGRTASVTGLANSACQFGTSNSDGKKVSLVSSFGKSGRIMCAKQLPSSGMRLLEGEVGMGHGHSWG
jgi:hypothetical protein